MQRRRPAAQDPSSSESEAQQAPAQLDLASSSPKPESDQGEDLEQALEQDYQPIPELDNYEDEGVDHEQHELNPEARRAAEKQLRMQEAQQMGQDMLEEYMGDSEEEDLLLRRARQEFYEVQSDEEDINDGIDPQEQRGSFGQWLLTPAVKRYIKRHFINFVLKFRHNNECIYFQRLKHMCINNLQSMEIDYLQFKDANPKLAFWLVTNPQQVIPEYSAALYAVAGRTFPSYKGIVGECYFKVEGIPVLDSLRKVTYGFLGQLIKVRGVVTHMGPVYNQLRKVYYKCIRCGYIKGPFFPNQKSEMFKLGACNACHVLGKFLIMQNMSVYRNHQTTTLQESPSDVEPGRVPRGKEVVLFGDNIDKVKPGDEVEAVGIFASRYDCALNYKQGFPIFHTFIEVNNITQVNKLGFDHEINQKEFQKFAKEKNFAYRLYNSIAPSIYGHQKAKRAITLALFGGQEQYNKERAHRTRGDLNILLLGEPGIAKSQFLKSIQRIFPRCVYTTGKGASAVGLTAAVKMDPESKEWKLEAGAMVLADKGVCLIDEFDKMSEQDRTSIHEAMEQQTISISKAGIVTTLNARCSVIAAANPTDGYYNEMKSFRDNVELSEPILSRFDLLCVMKDRPQAEKDGKLANFVINQHLISHPYQTEYICPEVGFLPEEKNSPVFKKSQDFLKQYIKYAREKVKPVLSSRTSKIINQAYVKLREHANQHGGLSIVVRHLESMVRIAEAHARMFLRKETNQQDANIAVTTMIQSFMDTQKYSVTKQLQKAFKRQLEHRD